MTKRGMKIERKTVQTSDTTHVAERNRKVEEMRSGLPNSDSDEDSDRQISSDNDFDYNADDSDVNSSDNGSNDDVENQNEIRIESRHQISGELAASPENSVVVEADNHCRTQDATQNDTEEPPNGDGSSSKRKYSYSVRKKESRTSESRMRKRWRSTIDGEESVQFDEKECCKKLECFKNVDKQFLLDKRKIFLNQTCTTRRKTLLAMLSSNGHFYFNGERVCSTFLRDAFNFSRDLQSSVKNDGSISVRDSSSVRHSSRSAGTSQWKSSHHKDSVICYLERLAERTSDRMPDTGEYHLPFFRKRDVYTEFSREFAILNGGKSPPSIPYFFKVWRHECSKIKVRRITRFSKCEECENLRAKLTEAVKNSLPVDDIKRRRRLHLEFIKRERLEYKKKRDEAIIEPDSYLSIIVDGADQSAFGLPHFTTSTKAQKGHSLKVKLIGLLEHAQVNKLHLFTLTGEYETGANHIIEVIHRFLMVRSKEGHFPPKMFIQLDNCMRENKNRYLLSYFECLVQWNVFSEVEVGFLPVGHTHEDIDQAFSCTSKRLSCHNAVTLSDLHQEVRQAYNSKTTVSSINSIIK